MVSVSLPAAGTTLTKAIYLGILVPAISTHDEPLSTFPPTTTPPIPPEIPTRTPIESSATRSAGGDEVFGSGFIRKASGTIVTSVAVVSFIGLSLAVAGVILLWRKCRLRGKKKRPNAGPVIYGIGPSTTYL